jgi:hypothetical protein
MVRLNDSLAVNHFTIGCSSSAAGTVRLNDSLAVNHFTIGCSSSAAGTASTEDREPKRRRL